MSLAIADVYASTTCISIGFWLAVRSAIEMPTGDSGLTSTLLFVTMSFSATLAMIAFARCDASSAVTSARAGSSSCARIRSPFLGPSLTSAGLDPKNDGAPVSTSPLTSVNRTETWCPSTRQPHAFFGDGVPNTDTKYSSGSRPKFSAFWPAPRAARSMPPSVLSRSMIDEAVR